MELDKLIEQFVDADQTLRTLIVSIEDVRSSRIKLDAASGELGVARKDALTYLEQARAEIAASIVESDKIADDRIDKTVASVETVLHQALEPVERRVDLALDALVDASRSLDSVVSVLKETSQALADSATSLRKLEPETIKTDLQRVLAELATVRSSQARDRYLIVATLVASIAALVVAVINL